MKNKQNAAIISAIISQTIFGFSFMFSKIALNYATPMVQLADRLLVAFIALTLILLSGTVKVSFKGKKLYKLFLLGLFQPTLYFVFESYGIKLTNSTFSSVMIALIPVVSLVCAIFTLKEMPSVLQVVFSILSVLGVIIMALLGKSQGIVTLVGVLCLLGAVFSSVFYNITSRGISGEFTPFERTYAMFLMGSVFYVIIALFEQDGNVYALLEPFTHIEFTLATLFLSVLSSVVAFMLLNFTNTHLPVARSTAFTNITTVVSVFAGAIFIKEPITLISVIASVMIIVGVWGVQKFRKEGK